MKPVLLLAFITHMAFSATPELHIKAAVVQYESAKAALAAKQAAQAAKLFERAIEIEPTYVQAYEGLIEACEQSGKPVETGSAITRLLEIKPDLVRYRLTLAKILVNQGDIQRALAQYSLALDTDPKNADALAGFAEAAAKLNMNDRAAEAKERGYRLYPSDPRFKE
jgi:tetratricopeptide (TPR) repeat protein